MIWPPVKNYSGEFKSWDDVKHEFSIEENEPDDVYFAKYDIAGYEGSARVVYRRIGKGYFSVYGGHCSCNGLEGQWQPVRYDTLALMIECLSKEWWANNCGIIEILKYSQTLSIMR